MTNTQTGGRVIVHTDGTAGPYAMAPLTQLNDLSAALRAADISFHVVEDGISLDGRPVIAIVNFGSREQIWRVFKPPSIGSRDDRDPMNLKQRIADLESDAQRRLDAAHVHLT